MYEIAQLSVIAIRDNTIGLHDFRDNLSMAMTKMCSLKNQQQQVGATGLAMGRLHYSGQCGLGMSRLVN